MVAYMEGIKYVNLMEISPVVIEIQAIENSALAVPVNNTLVCHTAFLAADTQLCVLISRTIRQDFFSIFSPFHSLVKRKGKQGRMKGLAIEQWINPNQNNRSVLAHRYSVL